MSRSAHLQSLRSTLSWLGSEVKYLRSEVDPVLEMTAINKAFDDGPVFVAETIAETSCTRADPPGSSTKSSRATRS